MMRLFTAITLDSMVKATISRTLLELERHSEKGNFTRLDNLHLTLVFIGETNNIQGAANALDRLAVPGFSLTLEGLGRFRAGRGDLYWMGVRENPPLQLLYSQLYARLSDAGFPLEKRGYRPHLTLGRNLVFQSGFDWEAYGLSLPPLRADVTKASLMKSEHINGILTYTEMYKKDLLFQ